jgi:hypothetical protein
VSNQRIIYLDIDGVLNSHSDLEICKEGNTSGELTYFNHGDFVNKGKVSLLHIIQKNTQASFVIVSSWAICKCTYEIGKFLNIPIHSKAHNCGGGYGRGEGVISHALEHGITADNYVVIDDSWKQMYRDWSRVCRMLNGREGLNELVVDEVNELFGI